MPRQSNSVKPATAIARLADRYGIAVVSIIGINLAVQVLFGIVGNGNALEYVYNDILALSIANLASLKLWTLVTYGFLHELDSIGHVLFNMLALFFLGPIMERRWGTAGFVRFWLACIVGGGIAGAVVYGVMGDPVQLVGASAAVMGVVGAWSWLFPEQKLLLFFVIPVKARWVVPAAVAIDVVLVATGSNIAIAAHLGGLATAWLLLNGYLRPRLLRTRLLHWKATRQAKKRRKFRVIDGGKGQDDDDDPRWNVH